MSIPITIAAGLSQEETAAVIDPLYRCTMGLDINDQSLFDSAWINAADAVFQMNDDVMVGLNTIHDKIFKSVGPLDTTHFINNIRVTHVTHDRKSASFITYALAQHYKTGEGVQLALEGRKNVLSGSQYWLDVVKDEADGLWKIKKWTMKIVWLQGDMSVLAG